MVHGQAHGSGASRLLGPPERGRASAPRASGVQPRPAVRCPRARSCPSCRPAATSPASRPQPGTARPFRRPGRSGAGSEREGGAEATAGCRRRLPGAPDCRRPRSQRDGRRRRPLADCHEQDSTGAAPTPEPGSSDVAHHLRALRTPAAAPQKLRISPGWPEFFLACRPASTARGLGDRRNAAKA
jgi:hypothetical protein